MEDRVSLLRCEIVRTVKDPLVMQHLIPTVISQDVGSALKRQYRMSTERANHRLLDLLYSSKEPGKWTAFLQALQRAGTSEYTCLVKLLKTDLEDHKTFNTCSKLIGLFAPQLEQQINPIEVLARLRSKNVISAHDQEEIIAKQTNEGAIAAAMTLLERIQIHLEPDEWYSKFLQVLHENQQGDLASMIDPDFDMDSIHNKEDKETLLQTLQEPDTDMVAADQEDSTENFCKAIQEFRGEIISLLKVPEIVGRLVPTSISQDIASHLIQLDNTDPVAASTELLEHMTRAPAFVHVDFLRCLRTAGYTYLANILSNRHLTRGCKYLRKFISLFEPTIQELIDPVDVVSLLVSEDIINRSDKENIMTARVQHGKTAAAMVMLDCVPRRLEPHEWYLKLLRILVQTDHAHVVRILDPEFLEDADNFTKKLYEEACSAATRLSEKTLATEISEMNTGQAINILLKHEQTFLQSAETARARFMSEKKKVDELFDAQRREFEERVTAQRRQLQEKVSRLKERQIIKQRKQIPYTRRKYDHM